jgi:hypothetical protein
MVFLQQKWRTRGWNSFYLKAGESGKKGRGGPNNKKKIRKTEISKRKFLAYTSN